MRTSEVVMEILSLNDLISCSFEVTTELLTRDFKAPEGSTNEESSDRFVASQLMANLKVAQSLHKLSSDKLDNAKTELDIHLTEMSVDTSAVSGETVTLHEDNQFHYQKKRNKDGTSYGVPDFIVALRSLGVELDVVNKAKAACAKTRKGNTYFIVEILDNDTREQS